MAHEAPPSLRAGLGKFADDLTKLVRARGKGSIDVGAFTGPATPVPSAGADIRSILSQELQARGIAVKAGAELSLTGAYLVVDEAGGEGLVLRLLTVVRDRRSKPNKALLNLDADIRSSRTTWGHYLAEKALLDALIDPEFMRKELGKFAHAIGKLAAARGKDSVDVGEFTGPATPPTRAGPGIQNILTQELKARRVTARSGADVYVKGEYLFVEVSDRTRQRLLLRLLAVVRDKRGKTLLELASDVTAPEGKSPGKP
jgi:hypothetical protein